MTKQWLNDTARQINDGIRQRRQNSPGIVLRSRWHEEFIRQGLDRKMSFVSYLKIKTQQWRQSKRSVKRPVK